MTSRRILLQGMALAPLASACSSGPRTSVRNFTPSGLPLRRVIVSPDRVIRTIAGSRPFRPSGFRLEAESFGDTTVIHNYGHGGGGITLSAGTSYLAMELAEQTAHRRCAVLGAGAVGLSAARLLQDRGWDVTIYARDLPPNTTSNIAGGQWSPTSVYDDDKVTPQFEAQFEAAMRHAYRYFQNLAGPRYGVRWISNYALANQPPEPNNFNDRYAQMYPELRDLSASQHPFPADYVRHYNTMLIEPAIYLPSMMQDFYAAGGKIVIRQFKGQDDALSLSEPVLINCTGLGSRNIFPDDELIPIKGQLSFLLPQEEIDYMTVGNGGLYMFPRRDGILLGGTFKRNDWTTTPDPEDTLRIIAGHAKFYAAMDDPWSH
jgi:D-amino-acid oxidase